jgi:phage baseplate assembly protein W
MAYVIGRKVLKDTEDFDSFAYGITLPIKNGETGFFEQAFTSYEQAKSNLKNLLLTKKGERIMQPNFGTGLQSLLFEQIDDTFEQKIQETITKNVNYWLPYISIKNIDVEMTNELKDQNRVNLSLEFTVGNQIDLQELTFTVQGTN